MNKTWKDLEAVLKEEPKRFEVEDKEGNYVLVTASRKGTEVTIVYGDGKVEVVDVEEFWSKIPIQCNE